MSLSSLTRFFSHAITPNTHKVSTLRFTSLSDELYTHLQNNPTHIEKLLNSIKPKLDSSCVNQVLHKLSSSDPQMGLRFFVWVGYQSNYRHSAFMYGKACDLFKIKQNPLVILDLIEAYEASNCVVSIRMFKVVMNLCKEGKLAREALLVLRKMPEFDLRPDTNAYNVVVRLFCDKGDMDMARKLMEEMGLIDLYPDMITYVMMIKGFCNVGRLEEACQLFKGMRRHGCEPNVVAYSALLDGLCRFESVEKVLDFLGEMEKEGGECRPNVLTYTSVIQSFCGKGRVIDALGILDRMEAFGCTPNRVTVSSLITGLCTHGQVDEAYQLIDRVGAGGSVSYGDCYSSLVVSLIRTDKVEDAEKLFRKVLATGVKLDSLACSLMIREIYLENRMLDSFYLFDQIENTGWLSSIDSDIYSILLHGLCEQNHSMEAARLARSILEKGIRLKGPYVGKIIECLKQFGEKDLVTKLVTSRIAH